MSSCQPSTVQGCVRRRCAWCLITVRTTAGEWEAIKTVSRRLGMTAETLRKWIRQAEIGSGEAPGMPTDAARQIRELKRKNAERERTVEIGEGCDKFFARELDPQQR